MTDTNKTPAAPVLAGPLATLAAVAQASAPAAARSKREIEASIATDAARQDGQLLDILDANKDADGNVLFSDNVLAIGYGAYVGACDDNGQIRPRRFTLDENGAVVLTTTAVKAMGVAAIMRHLDVTRSDVLAVVDPEGDMLATDRAEALYLWAVSVRTVEAIARADVKAQDDGGQTIEQKMARVAANGRHAAAKQDGIESARRVASTYSAIMAAKVGQAAIKAAKKKRGGRRGRAAIANKQQALRNGRK
jgi:hypothetical protein